MQAIHKHEITQVCQVLWDILPQFIFWKDTESRYGGCNAHFAKMLGFDSPAALIGKTDFELNWQVQGDNPWIFREGDQAVIRGEPLIGKEETLALPGREPLMVLVSKYPLRDEQQRIIGILGIALDITDTKKTEQSLKIAQAQADCARQAKLDFIDNISHDIRTPFTGIMGLSHVLTERLIKEEDKELAQLFSQASEQLLGWFNQIIRMVNVNANAGFPRVAAFSVRETLEELLTILQPVAKQKSLELRLQCLDAIPHRLLGDALRLKHLLLNIISNAITFTSQGSVMVMAQGYSRNDTVFELKITVIDTGIGIAPEDQSRIFEPFTRLDLAYKVNRHAPGLGLAMAKQLVQDMQGCITLQSTPGQGSQFCVTLPLGHLSEEQP